MPATASVVPMIDMPMPASPQNSSSLTIGKVRPVSSAQNWAIPSNPYSPILAASWITGHGVSSRSSHSSAAGRTTPSAKPCTQSRMSFWSWFSSSVNFGPSLDAPSVLPAASATSFSASATAEVSVMVRDFTRNHVAIRSDIAQVEGADPLCAGVGAVEEAAVDAVIGVARALVGALDPELAVRQRIAGHLDAAEAARLQDRVELDLGGEDVLHATDVLDAVEHVDEAVEVATTHLDAAAGLDHLVAERTALATLTGLLASSWHRRSLGTRGPEIQGQDWLCSQCVGAQDVPQLRPQAARGSDPVTIAELPLPRLAIADDLEVHVGLALVVLEDFLQLVNEAGALQLRGLDHQLQRPGRNARHLRCPGDLLGVRFEALGLLHDELRLAAVLVVEA